MSRFAVLIAAGAVAVALAAERPSGADTRALAPFLEEQTIGLLRVDVSRVDLDATAEQVRNLWKEDAAGVDEAKQELRRWRDQFTRAGGKEVVLVFSLADLPMSPPFALVPLGQGADADAIAQMLGGGTAQRQTPFRFEVHEKVGDVVFAGTKAQRRRFANPRPAERPEVARALSAAGSSTVQAVFVPSDDARRIVEQTAPTLPAELGGGSIKVLTDGVRWAALGLDLPPRASARLVVQSQDAGAAEALRKLVDNFFQRLKGDADFRKFFPDTDALAARLRPTVEGDRLVARLDQQGLVAILGPLVTGMRRQAARITDINNLKQIALAMHNYHDVYRTLPARAVFDKSGKPLLRWRVQILPFIEQQGVYKEFHLDEPWDSEHNRKLIGRMPAIYRSSRFPAAPGKTVYQVPVGPDTIFPPNKATRLRDVTDGTANTILVVTTTPDRAVIWTKPEDVADDPQKSVADRLGRHTDSFPAAFADGSVRQLPATIAAPTLHAFFTRNGGERIDMP